MNDLNAFLFQEWGDPDALSAGLVNVEALAEGLDFDGHWEERAFESVAPLEDVRDVDIAHGRSPLNAPGVSILHRSPHDVDGHVGLFFLTDVTPIEPVSPDHYERTFVQGRDCFAARDCQTALADNELTRDSLLLTARQDTTKAWRWVDLPDGRVAVSGRTWQPDFIDDGDDIIFQNYSVETWIPVDGGTLRFVTTWSETNKDIADPFILGSIDDTLVACDDYLDAQAR